MAHIQSEFETIVSRDELRQKSVKRLNNEEVRRKLR